MKVRDLCTRSVRTCGPGSSLADAGWAMWEGDCGILPIVDGENRVLGVITDRDICMAVVTKALPASQISAQDVSGGHLHSCKLDDDVKLALATMRSQGVRRLPVVDGEGKLKGILSLNDVTLAVPRGDLARKRGATDEDLIPTLQAVCAHRKLERDGEWRVPQEPDRARARVLK